MFVCGKCGREHSPEEYKESMFCKDCDTFLTRQKKPRDWDTIRHQSSRKITHKEKITYKDLFRASKAFEHDSYAYDDAWISAKENVDWHNLHNLADEEVLDKVIYFLNQWNCHLPKSLDLSRAIKNAYHEMIPHLEALENEMLVVWDGSERKIVNGIELSNSEILAKIFRRFYRIGHNFRDVATTKVLHMILPKLVVMWDTNICRAYGISKSPEGYVNKFIPMMKEIANEVVAFYMEENRTSREAAVFKIEELSKLKTMAKLIDEYNYMTTRR